MNVNHGLDNHSDSEVKVHFGMVRDRFPFDTEKLPGTAIPFNTGHPELQP